MFCALLLTNIGVLPPDAALYGAINKFLVPLAVPMLLLGADLRRVIRDTGSLLFAFLIGSVATIASTVAAAVLVPMHNVDGAWKIAAALCRYSVYNSFYLLYLYKSTNNDTEELLAPPAAVISAALSTMSLSRMSCRHLLKKKLCLKKNRSVGKLWLRLCLRLCF